MSLKKDNSGFYYVILKKETWKVSTSLSEHNLYHGESSECSEFAAEPPR